METITPSQVTPVNLAGFILAGNATFTVRSEVTQTRFTFKVRKPSADKPHFVSLLSGPDNENDFTFLGTIFNGTAYVPSSKYVSPETSSAKAAKWVVTRVLAGKPLTQCEIWHMGKCGRCGRALTVPESIESGIGPECAKKM